jgi:excisionase family DNA binding protein
VSGFSVALTDDLLYEVFSRARDLGLLPEQEPVPRLYTVKSAARYLDTSVEAVRGLIKRGQIDCNRSATGRITFTRQQLDAHAHAGDAS